MDDSFVIVSGNYVKTHVSVNYKLTSGVFILYFFVFNYHISYVP